MDYNRANCSIANAVRASATRKYTSLFFTNFFQKKITKCYWRESFACSCIYRETTIRLRLQIVSSCLSSLIVSTGFQYTCNGTFWILDEYMLFWILLWSQVVVES